MTLRSGARALVAAALLCAGCPSGDPPVEPTEGSAAPAEPEAPASRDGDVRVGEAFTEVTVQGRTGGPVEASDLADGCGGTTFAEPNHRLLVDALQPLTLDARPLGRGLMDLSLVVRHEDGHTVCADDSLTLDPVHAGMFEPGTYEVWIAARSEFEIPYELRIRHGNHEPDPIVLGGTFPAPVVEGTPPTVTTNGTYGGLQIPAGTAQHRFTGQAGGTRRAIDLGPDCTGWIAQVPDHVLELTAPETIMLRVRAERDTTLVVQGPERVWCTDDDDGLNPVLREEWLPGTYSVYVGAYAEDDEPTYTLSVSR